MKVSREKLVAYYPHLYEESTDWGNPRTKVYIECVLTDLIAANEKLDKDLAFEKEVNSRVRDVFSSWLGMPK